jgi:hypothetical protein
MSRSPRPPLEHEVERYEGPPEERHDVPQSPGQPPHLVAWHCWCSPELVEADPDEQLRVWRHRMVH